MAKYTEVNSFKDFEAELGSVLSNRSCLIAKFFLQAEGKSLDSFLKHRLRVLDPIKSL